MSKAAQGSGIASAWGLSGGAPLMCSLVADDAVPRSLVPGFTLAVRGAAAEPRAGRAVPPLCGTRPLPSPHPAPEGGSELRWSSYGRRRGPGSCWAASGQWGCRNRRAGAWLCLRTFLAAIPSVSTGSSLSPVHSPHLGLPAQCAWPPVQNGSLHCLSPLAPAAHAWLCLSVLLSLLFTVCGGSPWVHGSQEVCACGCMFNADHVP